MKCSERALRSHPKSDAGGIRVVRGPAAVKIAVRGLHGAEILIVFRHRKSVQYRQDSFGRDLEYSRIRTTPTNPIRSEEVPVCCQSEGNAWTMGVGIGELIDRC